MAIVELIYDIKPISYIAANPTKVLSNGEPIYYTNGQYSFGDGTTQLSALPLYGGTGYAFTGTISQYTRGDGTYATFPTNVSSFTNDSGYITSSALSPYLTIANAASTYAAIGDCYFSVTFNAGTQGSTMHNPADIGTVYIGNTLYLPSSNATHGFITIPVNATLIGYNINIVVAGVIGSGESASFYARVNNTTDITLSTAITYNSGTAYQQFESMALNTNVNANDKINIKVVYPSFATNPTSVFTGITLWFKRR